MRRQLGSVPAIALVAGFAIAAGPRNEQAPGNPAIPSSLPRGVTAATIGEGKLIFEGPGNCTSCHGADAKGTDMGPDLTAKKRLWVSDYASYVKLVTDGVPQPKQHGMPMPPAGGTDLTPDQVKAVAAYAWALGHPSGGK
jgi:mono/diheme cytochrome c family protein